MNFLSSARRVFLFVLSVAAAGVSVTPANAAFSETARPSAETAQMPLAAPSYSAGYGQGEGWYSHNAATKKIVEAHKNDFTYDTAASYLASKGGYKAYVKSLGGVFAKYADFTGTVSSPEQFYEIAEYVWGLYDIWGVDYSNGCTYTYANNIYKALAQDGSQFYLSEEPKQRFKMNYAAYGFGNGDDLPGIDEMLSNPKYYAITNCGQGVTQLLKKAGLIKASWPSPTDYQGTYVNSYGWHCEMITDASKLQPGDVLYYRLDSGTISSKLSVANWKSGANHTNVVVARDDAKGTLTFADAGHSYTYYGEGFYTVKIGAIPHKRASDWVAYRYSEISSKIPYKSSASSSSGGSQSSQTVSPKPAAGGTGGDSPGPSVVTASAGWRQQGKYWYYYDAAGKAVIGFRTINGKKYYFSPLSGTRGRLEEGWQKISSKWYYFNPGRGGMATGFKKISGKLYYLSSNGQMAEGGWNKIGKKWYYMNPKHNGSYGAVMTGWVKVKGRWYYMNSGGDMAEGGWHKIGGKWYFMETSHKGTYGAMKTGWITDKGRKYYLLPSGEMATGTCLIHGRMYRFSSSGALIS